METSATLNSYDKHDTPTKGMPTVGGVHVWEVPWSTDDMRSRSHSWSLAGDAGLLNKLQEMAQALVSRTHRIQQEMNALVQETDSCNARLSNTFNDFLMLSNTQFVENRVYDDEVGDVAAEDKKQASLMSKSKEERESEIVSRVSEALRLGLAIIDVAYEQLQVQDSDSEEEDEDGGGMGGGGGVSSGHEPILHPKDRYANRPLPYIIGTRQFMEDDNVGLGAAFVEGGGGELNEDDDESSLSSAAEENWSGDGPSQEKAYTKDYDRDSTSEDLNEGGNAYEAKELLDDSEDSHTSDLFSAQEARQRNFVDEEVEKKVGQKDSSSKSVPSNVRSHSISSVGSSGSSEGAASSIFARGGLPKESGGRKPVHESSPIIRTSDKIKNRSSIDSNEPTVAKSRASPASEFSAERDAGFGEGGDDDDDGGLFGGGGLFSKGERLFDDSQDLFSSTSVRDRRVAEVSPAPSTIASRRSNPSSITTEDLFGGSGRSHNDDDDDDEDLFSSMATSGKKSEGKNSIFTDDGKGFLADEKEEVEQPFLKFSPKKKLAGAKSMFGGAVNPLSFRLPHHVNDDRTNSVDSVERDERSEVVPSSRGVSRSEAILKPIAGNSASGGSLSLFSDEHDDDDLFGTSSSSTSVWGAVDSGVASPPKRTPFGGRDSVFGVSGEAKVEEEDGDDDDLFATKRKTTNVIGSGASSAKRSTTPSTDGDVPTPVVAPAKFSLFDDDVVVGETGDDPFDLFGVSGMSSSRERTTAAARVTAVGSSVVGGSKLLFGGDGLLFDADPDLDLFGSRASGGFGREATVEAVPIASPLSAHPANSKSMKDEAKSVRVSVPISSKTSSSGLFTDNDDDDLFGPSPTVVTDKSVQKVRQSPIPIARRIIPPDSKKVAIVEEQKKAESERRQSPAAALLSSSSSGSMEAVSPRKRPPAGGKSMFGGILPPLLNKPAPPDSDEEQEADVAGSDSSSPVPRQMNLESTRSLGIPISVGGTTSLSSSATFDEPVEANVLTSANKDRIKIPVKRRLPSRRGRQEALRKSAIEMPVDERDEDERSAVVAGSASAPTSPSSSTVPFFRSTVAPPAPKKTEIVTSPSTDEECDLFPICDAPTRAVTAPTSLQPRAVVGSAPAVAYGTEGGRGDPFGGSSDDGDDLFRPPPRAEPPKVSPKMSRQATHRLHAGVRDHASSPVLAVEKEDLFAVVGPTAKTSRTTTAAKAKVMENKGKSLFGDEDEDDDLFGSTLVTAKPSSIKTTSAIKSAEVGVTKTPFSSAGGDKSSGGGGTFDDPLGLLGGK